MSFNKIAFAKEENRAEDLGLELERILPILFQVYWVDEFNDDFVYIALPKSDIASDVECELIAHVAYPLVCHSSINTIYIGPFFWTMEKLKKGD